MNKKKIVFVVGGNGLLGKDIVNSFKNLDYKILILDIKIDKKILTKNILFFKFDVSKIQHLDKYLHKLTNKFGCPDIFINASYPRTRDWKNISFDNLKLNQLRKNVDIHMNSFAWTSLKIAQLMRKNKKKGSIIIVNSIYGLMGQDKNLYLGTNIKPNPVYSIIKSGLIGFVKNLSSYYGEFGIRVNSLISGGIKGHVAGSKKPQSKKFVKNYIKKTPLRRMGKPSDISSAVIFLASKESEYITGTNFYVDGGWSSI